MFCLEEKKKKNEEKQLTSSQHWEDVHIDLIRGRDNRVKRAGEVLS